MDADGLAALALDSLGVSDWLGHFGLPRLLGQAALPANLCTAWTQHKFSCFVNVFSVRNLNFWSYHKISIDIHGFMV